MRNTKQKLLILDIINNSFDHMTAEDIYLECKKKIPNISLGTIYRNLNILVSNNLIKRIKMNDNTDRFDKNHDHCHIICTKCGKINDVFGNFLKDFPKLENYYVMNYELIFNGICKKCKEEGK